MRSLAVLAVLLSSTTTFAGWKCKRLPAIVYWSEAADVHDDGTYHRTIKGKEHEGFLEPKALDKFRAFVGVDRTDAKVLPCLDALIGNAITSNAVSKACAPPKHES